MGLFKDKSLKDWVKLASKELKEKTSYYSR